MRALRQIDFTIYVQALKTYWKNPIIALAPLAAELTNVLLRELSAGSDGLLGFLALLIDLFGSAVAVIAADHALRRKNTRFSEACSDARRKAADILTASIGVTFVLFIPSLFGSIFGPLVPLLQGIAVAFMIYAIPAAAIGGTPGAATLQASVDRARAQPAATAVLFLVCYAAYQLAPLIAGALLSAFGNHIEGTHFVLIALVVSALTRGLSFGYIALLLAQAYR